MPLDSHISKSTVAVGEELILNYEYMLEALVIDESKKILLSVAIPLTIGTTPCFNTSSIHDECDEDSTLCYVNYGRYNY